MDYEEKVNHDYLLSKDLKSEFKNSKKFHVTRCLTSPSHVHMSTSHPLDKISRIIWMALTYHIIAESCKVTLELLSDVESRR